MADVKSLIISGFTQQRTQAKQGAGSRAWGRGRGRGGRGAQGSQAGWAAAYPDKLRGSLGKVGTS